MKKIFITLSLLLVLSSCVSTRNIVDVPMEGVYIQVKEKKYQVYNSKYYYIIKTDIKGKTIRQMVYLGI
jgi:hypothetical protein